MDGLKKIPVILDGDPGHDDAIAWVLAKSSPLLDIRACTSVCGNQTIEKTTYNALRICTLIGNHAPFGVGRPRPLVAEPIVVPTVHGKSGLDGPDLPEPDFEPCGLSAPALMEKVIEESEGPVTIVPTGPLTNVAALLLTRPDLKPKIARISLMGGGIAYGNWTPAAEFNILVDPEAAKVVYESGIPIYMAGLDVTEKALVFPEDFERMDWLEFFYGFHRKLGYPGAPVHDAVAVAALIKPEIMTFKDLYVQVETAGDYCKGTTVGDWYGVTGKAPNASCILDIDRQGFVDLLVEAVKTYA